MSSLSQLLFEKRGLGGMTLLLLWRKREKWKSKAKRGEGPGKVMHCKLESYYFVFLPSVHKGRVEYSEGNDLSDRPNFKDISS